MKRVDSQALDVVSQALGLAGRGAPATEFSDGILDQVLDVSTLVRRGRTLAGQAGIYSALIRNIHAVADTQLTTINPFNMVTGAIAPWPVPTPRQFDMYLLGAGVRQLSGSGTFTGALLYTMPSEAQAWGIDSAGLAVVADSVYALAFWDSVVTESIEFALRNGGNPYATFGLRLPNNPTTELAFSSTSSALATFDLHLMLGLFPVGLGQDVQV